MAEAQPYEPQVAPQVQPSAELPATARPETFGSGMGAAMENAAEIATRYHHEAYQQANQTAALDHNNVVEKWGQDNVYGINGVLGKPSGKNAPAVTDQTLKGFDDFAAKQMEGAANDDQRLTFQRINQAKRAELEKHLGAYEHAQVTQYQDQTDEAAISNAATSAAHNAYDGQHVQDQIGKMQAVIADRGARKGLAPELVKVQQQEAASGTHLSVMEQMAADGNNAAASQYLQTHQGDFTGRDLLQAKRMVEAGNRDDQSRKVADSVLDKLYENATDQNFDESQVTMERALGELESRKIQDTRVYDQAKQRLIQHFKVQDEAHQDAQRGYLQQVDDYMRAPGNDTYEVPANLYAKLDLHNQRAIDAAQTYLRKQDEPVSDTETKGRLYEMSSDPQQWDDFLKIPPQVWRANLSPKDFDRYQKERAHVQAQVEKRDDTLSQGAISFKVAQDIFHDLGVAQDEGAKPGSSAYEATRKLQDQFMDHLHRAVGQAQLEKERNLTEDEIRDVAKELSTQQSWTVPASWWDRNIPSPLTTLNIYSGGRIPAHIWDSTQASGMKFQVPWGDKMVYQMREIPGNMRPQLLDEAVKAGVIKSTDQYDKMTREDQLRINRYIIQAYNSKIEAEYRAQQR